MRHHSKMSVAVLVVVISLLPWLSLGSQTFAETSSLTSPAQYTTGEGTTAGTIEEQLELAKEKIANARQAEAYGSPTSSMNFDMFMNSFANSVFNGTSIFGAVGTSMVNGIRVSGIGLDKSGSQLSVTLSGAPMKVLEGGNNLDGINNYTTVTTTTNLSNSVSLIAMRIPINMADILSLAAASSSQGVPSDTMMGNMDLSAVPSDSLNSFSLLSNLQIGSTSITSIDWSVPQTVTMNLVGGNSNQEQLYSNNVPADFLLVSVIPYTGNTLK